MLYAYVLFYNSLLLFDSSLNLLGLSYYYSSSTQGVNPNGPFVQLVVDRSQWIRLKN